MRKEEIILSALTSDQDFTKKVITYIQPEFFADTKERITFELIADFYKKYGKTPTHDVLSIEIEERKDIPENDFDDAKNVLKSAFKDKYEYDQQWLIDETERFCKDRAVYLAIMKSVMIINGEEKKLSEGAIPKLLQDALSIGFDHSIGHDYFEDAKARFEFYHRPESKIRFAIEMLNKVTNKGVNRKTLNMLVAQPKGGKSLAMCSLAADYLRDGLNVLYITLELAEERIAERIDANMFNVPMSAIHDLDESIFTNKISSLEKKTNGRLKIKEYATKSASSDNIRVLLDDLKSKDDFEPDVVFVDYLGITASSQFKNASNVNSYSYQKAVSEELRAVAVDYNLAMWTALQVNRSGFNSSDFDIDSIADSTGPLMTCDLALGIIRTPELTEMNQAIIKQLASRYGDSSYFNKFVVGIDLARMKMFNVEGDVQSKITQDVDSREVQKPASSKTKKFDKADEWNFDD